MQVLGVSAFYHDSAAALVNETGIVAACQQERYTRRKNDPGFPAAAIEDCLAIGGIAPEDLDAVVYYEKPLLKLARVQRTIEDNQTFHRTAARWLQTGQLGLKSMLAERIGVNPSKVHTVRHHQAHAASAYYASPFDAATVVTLDGVGEDETATVSEASGRHIIQRSQMVYPDSLGLFYSAFTAYLGFEVNEGEYKVMGMAPFGEPVLRDEIRALFELHEDGGFALQKDTFDFDPRRPEKIAETLSERFGPARAADDVFDPAVDSGIGERSRRYADVAASVQAATEDVISHVVSGAIERTGISQVCLAGGVALNSVANGRLMQDLGIDLFVQPAAGDAGGALGAALWHWHTALEGNRLPAQCHALLGGELDLTETAQAVQNSGYPFERVADDSTMIRRCADALAAGQVIGWVQGRAEWGPRALGARSILAAPAPDAMRDRVNEKIKFRELFRPFAPAVPAEHASRFFQMPDTTAPWAPVSFMLSVHPVRPEMREIIPAVTHVDGSARVQVVHRETNPMYHDLLSEMGRSTDVPVLLNTSFNRRGEPIVNDAYDALTTFRTAGLDCLSVGPFFVRKGE